MVAVERTLKTMSGHAEIFGVLTLLSGCSLPMPLLAWGGLWLKGQVGMQDVGEGRPLDLILDP